MEIASLYAIEQQLANLRIDEFHHRGLEDSAVAVEWFRDTAKAGMFTVNHGAFIARVVRFGLEYADEKMNIAAVELATYAIDQNLIGLSDDDKNLITERFERFKHLDNCSVDIVQNKLRNTVFAKGMIDEQLYEKWTGPGRPQHQFNNSLPRRHGKTKFGRRARNYSL